MNCQSLFIRVYSAALSFYVILSTLGASQRALRNEKGQAMTEYIYLIILVALVCIPVVELLPQAVLGYVRPFYYCISRPIP